MNKVIESGRLCKDPDVRYSQGGMAVANFSIAVDRRFKRDGEPTADFFNCVAFSKTAEFVEKYFSKGSGILIEGHLQNDEYTNKDGQKVTATKIYVDQVDFMGGKQNG
jgi:single-strand DNA-binding protein